LASTKTVEAAFTNNGNFTDRDATFAITIGNSQNTEVDRWAI